MAETTSDSLTLQRDCAAIQVPYGNTITLRSGTQLSVVQQLGDSLTVRTEHGYLLRLAASDADALGLVLQTNNPQPTSDPSEPLSRAALWEVLKSIYDPEIPANIVDLGLIYNIEPQTLANGKQSIAVQMTLTAPGCGMGQVLQDDVQRKLAALPQVETVQVELVFDPPWEQSMMSDAARLQLGML